MGGKHISTPDFKGAAEGQAVGNHPDVNTAFGSLDWQQGRDANGNQTWTANVNMTPDQQAAVTAQQGIQSSRSQAAQGLLGNAESALSNGIDWNSLGTLDTGNSARDQAITGAYNQSTSRLDPQYQQAETSMRNQLYAQGLREGDQAFDTQMANFGRQKTDAYQTAMNNAIGQGTQAQQATFGENLQSRQQGLNEQLQKQYNGLNAVNALTNGQQVSMPNFEGLNNTQGANYEGAAQNQYQANLNQFNANQMGMQNLYNGIGSLASSGMTMFGF